MRIAILCLALLGCGASAAEEKQEPVAALVGTTPPEWQVERWINSAPITLASLRGSVVLVRWWTAGCPFCSTSAPALRGFNRSYAERGLKVLGMYHHKESTPFDPRVYEETARKYEFTFPIAFDPEWRTFKSWLRDKQGRAVDTGWTSVTFLLDKCGVVRLVHPGGQYVDGDPAHREMTSTIERLLAEPVSCPASRSSSPRQ
jgi:peroxiredoxin